MTQILAVAIGGAVGALLRFWVSIATQAIFGRAFPYATLAVNTLGSFLMGLLFVWITARSNVSDAMRAGLLVGLLGAFTTFSTFSFETMELLQHGEHLKALVNIVLSVALCLLACGFGLALGAMLRS